VKVAHRKVMARDGVKPGSIFDDPAGKVTESPNESLPVNSRRSAPAGTKGAVSRNEFWKGGSETYSADTESRICHPLLLFPFPGHPRLEFAALERDTETW
jgi:hypothetical protein